MAVAALLPYHLLGKSTSPGFWVTENDSITPKY
jgi:hypothetical protein